MAKKILISNVLPKEALDLIPKEITVDYNSADAPLPKAELLARLKGKDGLVCHIVSAIDDEVLAAAPTLKVVANVAVGYNNIDVAVARRRGVVVTNTPDVLTETTADFAWALLMAAARRVVEADHFARSGQWQRWQWDLLWGADVHGKTLGILGFGRIGRAVARRARGFDMEVLHTGRTPGGDGHAQQPPGGQVQARLVDHRLEPLPHAGVALLVGQRLGGYLAEVLEQRRLANS